MYEKAGGGGAGCRYISCKYSFISDQSIMDDATFPVHFVFEYQIMILNICIPCISLLLIIIYKLLPWVRHLTETEAYFSDLPVKCVIYLKNTLHFMCTTYLYIIVVCVRDTERERERERGREREKKRESQCTYPSEFEIHSSTIVQI